MGMLPQPAGTNHLPWRGTVFESSDTGNKSIHWSNSSRGATVQPTTVHLDALNQLDLDSGRAALAQRTIDSLNDTHKLKALGELWCDQRTPRRPQPTKKGAAWRRCSCGGRRRPFATLADDNGPTTAWWQIRGSRARRRQHEAPSREAKENRLYVRNGL